MGDRPIIFSAPMVRALLDGCKTQTRRLATSPLRQCAVGDRLYVREAWHVRGRYTDVVEVGYSASQRRSHTEYVEQFPVAVAVPGKGKWPTFPISGPSIHMPRWASRLTLVVEAVRTEPLQAISEADAAAEGVRPLQGSDGPYYHTVDIDGGSLNEATAALTYKLLWNVLHGEESWAENPDVLALTFRVERGNIDRIAA